MDVVILDFSKAFDTVPHDKLMHKLEKYGIKGDLHKWLTSFLTKIEMRVVSEGEQSNKAFRISRVCVPYVVLPCVPYVVSYITVRKDYPLIKDVI
jgi:uncharacterized protein (UPF0371 family)